MTLPEWTVKFPKFKAQDLSELFGERLGEMGLDLLAKLLEINRIARITANYAVQHPFVN